MGVRGVLVRKGGGEMAHAQTVMAIGKKMAPMRMVTLRADSSSARASLSISTGSPSSRSAKKDAARTRHVETASISETAHFSKPSILSLAV